jgi:hypothetical protein
MTESYSIGNKISLQGVDQRFGYFVRTAGNVTDKMIKNHIERHEYKEEKYSNF